MPSTTANALFWADCDAEFELIITHITVNNTEYWKGTHCDKKDMKRGPWRGHHKTFNLLNCHHSHRYQEQLRMPIDAFQELIKFCLQHTELRSSKHVTIEEKVYIFLYIVGQPASNRSIQEEFVKSGETVSR